MTSFVIPDIIVRSLHALLRDRIHAMPKSGPCGQTVREYSSFSSVPLTGGVHAGGPEYLYVVK